MSALTENTINIYFSYENVIGSYLHHELDQDVDNVLVQFAGFIILSKNHVYIKY